jgi:hypothetical protein
MSNVEQITLTTQDIDSAAWKLEEFSRGLSPNERVVIDWLLERAATAPPTRPSDDLVGFVFPGGASGSPVPRLAPQAGLVGAPFNRALGLQPGGVSPSENQLILIHTSVSY